MKIVANLPDINQLFNDGLKDIFPYSNIRVCVIHRVSGEILHIFRDIGKPIRFKDFAFNIKEHDLGLYIPSFYAKRNWKSNDICEDSILTIGANTISFNGYDAMPIFIRPDGSVRKYVVVGLTRGVMDNGVLRSIPGRYPSSGYTIEEFRSAVRKGRDPKKWGLMNQDMFDCLQLLFKFAFQVTKTKEALGNGLGREKCLTGGTLVLGGQSGYTDPFQFGKDKPDARLKSLICVVDGRLQFSNWDGKFSPIKIANNKTLDECIVEETEDYIIYSDGDVTPDNPIPEGIYFACRVDKHTGEIYYGEGYENLARINQYSSYITREDLYSKYIKFKKIRPHSSSAWGYLVRHQFSTTDIVNYSTHVLFSSLGSTTALRGSLGYNGGYYDSYIYKLLGDNYTGFYEFRGIKATGEPNLTESINIDMHQGVPTNSEVHLMNALVTKNTKTNLVYIFNKVPYGKIEFNRKTTGIDGLSLLFKNATNFKEEDDKWSANNWVCWLNYNGSKGRLVSAGSISKLDNTDMYLSKAGSELLSLGSVPELNDYKTTGIKIAGIINDTRRTNIIKAFIFYSGELSKAELEAEKNKTFKLKKFYRTNSNQSSFLGLEDIFTNNNTKEIIDGTIIDTTKTPIEYKEQKDISKTSDISSYTKNNINIEKSKCGYIRDIRNTNDFKNLPNNLVTEPSKYDEKYQSPTVNIVSSVLNTGVNSSLGTDNLGDYFIISRDDPWGVGLKIVKNNPLKNTQYTFTFEIMTMEPDLVNRKIGMDFNQTPSVDGSGNVNDNGHYVLYSESSVSTIADSIGVWKKFKGVVQMKDMVDWTTIDVVVCGLKNDGVVFKNKKIYYRNIQILEGDFRNQDIDYTPPNSDGNFVPTIGESGIFSVKQTTKDTDKNTNTFARTIFLP